MIALLIFPADAAQLNVELTALLPHLDRGDQLLVAQDPADAEGAHRVDRALAACGDPRCIPVWGRDLAEKMTGDYLLPLAPGMRLCAGALAEVKRFVRRWHGPPSVRFAEPDPVDRWDRFGGRRRRLFGVPLRLELTKPYLLHRDILERLGGLDGLGGLGGRDLVASLRDDDPGVAVEMELADEGGPDRGAWAPVPVLEGGHFPAAAPDAEAQRQAYVRFIERSGRPVTLQTTQGGLRVEARQPRGIDIELTTRCNARCIFCPQRDLPVKQHMTDEVFERVLAMIRSEPLGTIYFIGRGEPLMHPRFVDYVREIRNWTGIEFEVFTNGLALVPAVVDQLVGLNDEELNIAINVSLHSLKEETHRALTGTELRTVSENLKYLHRKGNALRITYAFVKNKINEAEMVSLRRHLDRTGNRDWDISLVYNKGGFVDPGELFDEAFYQRQRGPDQAEVPATGPCWYSYSGQYYWVNVQGQFTLCNDDFNADTILGEVGTDSLEAIDARVADLRTRGGAERCKRCNKRQREAHHGGYGEDLAQVKGRFRVATKGVSP
jgi:MoaA/NifB/PqqE/SkfB family radical SAM enzyme